MKSIGYRSFGAAREVLRLEEVERPAPADGEVLVRLQAAGVNPSDVKLRAGRRPGGATPVMPFPRIEPHSDGAGVIEAVGTGVSAERLGQRVWLWNAQWERAHGACSEFLALPADQAVPLPDAAGFDIGACLGIPAVTAHAALFKDLREFRSPGAETALDGQTVVVTGAAGAVGRYAVQMARLAGATVIATISGPEKAAEAEAAGAHHIVNYRSEPVAERVLTLTRGRGADRIVDVEFGGNLAASVDMIAPRGVISAYASMAAPEPALPFYPLMFKNVSLNLLVVYRLEDAARRRAERDLSTWLEAGALDHKIAARFPFEETAAAHELVESGDRIGAVIVTL